MKKQNYLLVLCILMLSFSACKKEKTPEAAPEIVLNLTEKALTLKLNSPVMFEAQNKNSSGFQQEWVLDGKQVSTEAKYSFEAQLAGNYVLVYTAFNEGGEFKHEYKINVAVPVIEAGPNSSKFISKVFAYVPAPGQFINEGIGSLAGAQKIIGDVSKTSLLSLGAYGGYVVFGFDHSVINQQGYDLGIYGNPIGGNNAWAEPGIVMVSQDKNGNGLPDDEWYELAGSAHQDPLTIKNYEITYTNPKAYANVNWTDNQGKTGAVEINNWHKHNYYPEFVDHQDKMTFKGTLLPSTFGKNGSIFVNNAFEWGYTDSWSIIDDYAGKRYNSIDIHHAIDAQGKKVKLSSIDFVKVYTGQNEKGNTMMGEISTEIKGAIDLGIK